MFFTRMGNHLKRNVFVVTLQLDPQNLQNSFVTILSLGVREIVRFYKSILHVFLKSSSVCR